MAEVEAHSHTIVNILPPEVSNIKLEEDTYILRDGTVLSDIIVGFREPQSAILEHYNVYYELNNNGNWQFAGAAKSGLGYKLKALPQAKTVKVKVVAVDKYTAESNGVVSAEYAITGKSNPPGNVRSFTAEQDPANRSRLLLAWEALDATMNPDIKGYEVRLGDNWETAHSLGNLSYDTKLSYLLPKGGSYSFLVKAIDNSGNYSFEATSAAITAIVVPSSPVKGSICTDRQDSTRAVLAWEAVGDTDLSNYEVRLGTDWENGTMLLVTKESSCYYKLEKSGKYSFMVAARNVAGYYSAPLKLALQANIEPLAVLGFTAAQAATDRTKVRLCWEVPVQADIAYYEIRVGSDWETGTVIGSRVTGTFFELVVDEQAETDFWIKAVNVGGKYSLSAAKVAGIFSLSPDLPTNLRVVQDINDRSKLIVTWDGIAESDLLEYELRLGYTWASAKLVSKTKETKVIHSITETGDYKFILKSKNNGQFYSNETFVHYRAVVEPAKVDNFKAVQNGDKVMLLWDKSQDQDVAGYEIRQGASFESGALVVSGITVQDYSVQVDNDSLYQFNIKAINRAGHYSLNEAIAQVAVDNLPPKNVILEFDELILQEGKAENTAFEPSSIKFSTLGGKFCDAKLQ